ncbi:MAG TPA: hypothetical protein ENJ16_05635 [Planctomycetaceae bacterium]|nr:hypothetical protein [Planctomycetaceae bacterium]
MNDDAIDAAYQMAARIKKGKASTVLDDETRMLAKSSADFIEAFMRDAREVLSTCERLEIEQPI